MNCVEREGAGDSEDLGARSHDLENDLVAELNGRADEFAVGLFEDALFFAGFEERVHGFGGMVLLGGVFWLGKCGDGEQQAEQQGDRQDEVEEGLQKGRMRVIQRPRVRVKRSWGRRRSKRRMSRMSSKTARTISLRWWECGRASGRALVCV